MSEIDQYLLENLVKTYKSTNYGGEQVDQFFKTKTPPPDGYDREYMLRRLEPWGITNGDTEHHIPALFTAYRVSARIKPLQRGDRGTPIFTAVNERVFNTLKLLMWPEWEI